MNVRQDVDHLKHTFTNVFFLQKNKLEHKIKNYFWTKIHFVSKATECTKCYKMLSRMSPVCSSELIELDKAACKIQCQGLHFCYF